LSGASRNVSAANTVWILNTNGSNNTISYNTTTGALSLIGGRTYRITTVVGNTIAPIGTSVQSLEFSWCNTSSNTAINAGGVGYIHGTSVSIGAGSTTVGAPTVDWMYSPVANTTINLVTTSTPGSGFTVQNASLVVTEIK
jgi:hypothetical protein